MERHMELGLLCIRLSDKAKRGTITPAEQIRWDAAAKELMEIMAGFAANTKEIQVLDANGWRTVKLRHG